MINRKNFLILILIYLFSLKATYLLILLPINTPTKDVSTQCQSIVVLGGRDNDDRILKGLELIQLNRTSLPIFSGISKKDQEIVKHFGLQNIIFEENSTNTYENAKYTSQYLKNKNIYSACLVTSKAHLYRAKKVFSNFGISTIAIVSNATSNTLNISSFLPDLKYFVLNISVIYEYLAIPYYKFKYRV